MYCKIVDVTKGRTETIFTMLEQVDAHAGTLCIQRPTSQRRYGQRIKNENLIICFSTTRRDVEHDVSSDARPQHDATTAGERC
jgi:hypothetical protein